jgi:N-acyl-D-aspartate/D-glutamate deacylase
MRERDLLLRGGDVIDGSGAPRFRADVRVRDGRVVEVADGLSPDGEPEVDAAGAVVCPGFIDSHAHTDAQVFWNPALDPDPQHGVTTMLVGNCSLSLHPVTEQSRGMVADLFAVVEDVPRDLFEDHVPWTWSTYAGYRDAVNAVGTGVNLAALVGHSPLRLAVMGEDAWSRAATGAERDAMATSLRDAMGAGAWGLSTSFFDTDQDGRPVPSRAADAAELDALLDVLADAGRGLVEFVPDLMGTDPEVAFDDLARRCGARGIPVTWTGFVYSDRDPRITRRWLDRAAELTREGVRIHPQLSPRTVDFRLNWDSSAMFLSMPEGWNRVIAAEGRAKADLLRDPGWRATARAEWDTTPLALFPHRRLHTVRIVEVVGDDNGRWLGRTLADVVEADGGHPSDVFADFVLANDCHPGIVAVGVSNADVDGVARTLADPAVLVSSSDTGAHLQMLCASGDTTLLLTRHVRERDDFTLEQAVHELTGRQADAFGFHGRGSVGVGGAADLVVFALDELHYDTDTFVPDLPNGAARLRRPAGGYRSTIVDGVLVQQDGELTGALPGRVISSAGD